MKSVLDEISDIIEWYRQEYSGAGIEHLMNAKSKLLVLLARFSEEVSAHKRESVMATVFRKADHHDRKARMIDDGFTQGLAESKTIASLRSQYTEEAKREAIFFKSKLIFDVAVKITDDLQQRIAYLRKERELSNG